MAARLKANHPHMIHVHCVAHREALAAADAYSDVTHLKNTFQPTLGGVFRYFDGSATREAGLHQVQELLEFQMTKLKEPKFVRWLLNDAAVKAFVKCLAAITAALEREAVERHEPAAEGYAKRVKTGKFIASLLLFADVLAHRLRLLCEFQEVSLDYSQLNPALKTTELSIRQLNSELGTHERKLDTFLEAGRVEISDEQLADFRTNIRQPYLDALLNHLQR